MHFKLTIRWIIFLNLASISFISGCNPSEESSVADRVLSAPDQQDAPVTSSQANEPSTTNLSQDSPGQNSLPQEDEVKRNIKTSNSTNASGSSHQQIESEEITSSAGETPSIEQLQDAVIDSLEAGELDLAWNSIRVASRIDRDNFDTRYLKARVLAERNRFAEAVKQLDQLAEEDPNVLLPVLGQTAEWLTYDGRWKAAESRFRTLIDLAPEVGMAHRKLAELLIREGKRTEACKYFAALCEVGNIEEVELRQLLKISSAFRGTESTSEQTPIGSLGMSQLHFGEGKLEDALIAAQNSKTLSPEMDALTGRLHAMRGDQDQLAMWATRNDEQSHPLPSFWFAKGVLAQMKNDHAQAINYFCRSVLLDPTDADSYEHLSESLMADQQTESAKNAAIRAEQLRETHAIGQRFTSNEAREPEQIARLCDLLEQLQRPYESLAWRAVGIVYNHQTSGLSDQEITSQLRAINQQRTKLIESDSKLPTEDFILCGAKTATRE